MIQRYAERAGRLLAYRGIMSNPAPGQAEGQDREAGSTHGAPVPSLQRNVQGGAVGTDRWKRRAHITSENGRGSAEAG